MEIFDAIMEDILETKYKNLILLYIGFFVSVVFANIIAISMTKILKYLNNNTHKREWIVQKMYFFAKAPGLFTKYVKLKLLTGKGK